MKIRTSLTDPIRVDFLPLDAIGLPGKIGMTFAPGKKATGRECRWERDLQAELARLHNIYRGKTLISLVEDPELLMLGIADLVERAQEAGLTVRRLPIVDGGTPGSMPDFLLLVREVVTTAAGGDNVIIHCRGGLGRAGLFAASCLVGLGREPVEAIRIVRRARAGAIENRTQEGFIEALAHHEDVRNLAASHAASPRPTAADPDPPQGKPPHGCP